MTDTKEPKEMTLEDRVRWLERRVLLLENQLARLHGQQGPLDMARQWIRNKTTKEPKE